MFYGILCKCIKYVDCCFLTVKQYLPCVFSKLCGGMDFVGRFSDKITLQDMKSAAARGRECLVERHTQQPCTRNSHAE